MAKKQKTKLKLFVVPVVRYGYTTGNIAVQAPDRQTARRQLDNELLRGKISADDVTWSEFHDAGGIQLDEDCDDDEGN